MPYDFDGADRSPPEVTGPTPDPKDLEVIVTLLQLAALELTPEPDMSFTFEDLLKQALVIGGSEVVLDSVDVQVVFPFLGFLKKLPGGRYSLK